MKKIFFCAALLILPRPASADNSTVFEMFDDLTVMGMEGSETDPVFEVQGFTVFGSTQTSYPGIIAGPGNVAVNGYLWVSSGAYFAPGAGNIGVGTTAPGEKLEIAGGNLKVEGTISAAGVISGSNLSGTNTGDQTITLTGDVTGGGTGSFAAAIADNSVDGSDIFLGGETRGDVMFYDGVDWALLPAGAGGQVLQTQGPGANPVWAAPSAGGSDNLGNHTATATLEMGANNITGSGSIAMSTATFGGNSGIYGLTVSSNVSLAGTLYTKDARVGVGTAAPAATLDVNGIINAAAGFRLAGAAASGNYLRGNGANFVAAPIQAGDVLAAIGGVPSLTLSTVNGAGSAATFVRTDATLLAFDAVSPAPLGAAAPGSAAVAARRDHVHAAANLAGASTAGVLPISKGGTNSSTALSGSSIMVSNGASIVQGSKGAANTLLHGNAAGLPSYSAVLLTAEVSGILPSANGGTANGFTKFTGPVTTEKTFTLPNTNTTILTHYSGVSLIDEVHGILPSANGGTANGFTKFTGPITTEKTFTLPNTNTTILTHYSGVSLIDEVHGILPSANGGTANGFTKFTGPVTTEKTFTLPNASTTILTHYSGVSLLDEVHGILPSANGGTANGFTRFTGPVTTEKTFTLPNENTTILTHYSGVSLADEVNGILSSGHGGTANGFTKFTGPVTTEKTFTLPNVNTTILTSYSGVSLATEVNGILSSDHGGTANGFTRFTGPVTTEKTFTLPNENTTILTHYSGVSLADEVNGILSSGHGGTANGFTKFTGPVTTEKTFTLPNVNTTILTSYSGVSLATEVNGILSSDHGGTANGFTRFTGPVTTEKTFTLPNVNTTILTSYSGVSLATEVNGILGSDHGGTANGFTRFTGPVTTEKTFTLPNASAAILTTNAAVTVAQGGTGLTAGNAGGLPYYSAANSMASMPAGTAGQVLTSGGAGAPVWAAAPGADNLGNHTATTALKMGANQITGTGSITMSTATFTGSGGIYGLTVSSNVSLAGVLYTAGGNVGIGTTAPTATLVVGGASGANSVLINDVDTAEWKIGTGYYGLNFSNDIDNNGIYDNRMFIDSAGKVGIGTISPGAQLEVDGYGSMIVNNIGNLSNAVLITHSDNAIGNTDNAALWIQNTGAGSYTFRADDAENDTTPFIIDNSGKVGIGTGGPLTHALTLTGSAWASGSWVDGSDRRWKKDITPLKNSLDKVMKLQGVSYNWNTEDFPEYRFSTAPQTGLIAQDTEKVIPEVVITDNRGYKGITYEKLVPALIEAIKEQQKEIKEQQEKTAALEAKIAKLEEEKKQ